MTWISVHDKLPRLTEPISESEDIDHELNPDLVNWRSRRVLTADDDHVSIGRLCKCDGGVQWADDERRIYYGVTHWMDLPEPEPGVTRADVMASVNTLDPGKCVA